MGSDEIRTSQARIVVATNVEPEDLIERGKMLPDLLSRFPIVIHIPPLNARRVDIPLLVNFYVEKIAKRLGKTIEIIPASVMNALKNYHWPGNVRELENVLERGVINSSSPKLRLIDELQKPVKNSGTGSKTLATVERDYIIRVLEQTHWKISGKNSAAEILDLDRSTLRARIRKLGITKP